MSEFIWDASNPIADELTEPEVKRLLSQLNAYQDEFEVLSRAELREHFCLAPSPVFELGGQRYTVRAYRVGGFCMTEHAFHRSDWRSGAKAACLNYISRTAAIKQSVVPGTVTYVYSVSLTSALFDGGRLWRVAVCRMAHVKPL